MKHGAGWPTRLNGTIQERSRIDIGDAFPAVEVILFTDPYSSWCWATEPVWLRLKETYGGRVHFRTVMGGLVESGAQFFDPQGQRLAWIRQHLREVSKRSGQPIDPAFLDGMDDSFSTWPACIHVKAAQLQGEDLGHRMLRRLRRAIMMEHRQGSDPVVASEAAADVEGLDLTMWRGALADGTALGAFLEDRNTCQRYGIHGFPTFVIRTSKEGRAPRVLTGYRPYQEIEDALRGLAPWLEPRDPRPVVDLLFDCGPMTTREVQEVEGASPREALDALDELVAEGTVEASPIAGGTLWALAEAQA